MAPPVSVCHQVSMMGSFLPPTTRWNQCQASGLMGSPTLPSRRSELRLCTATGASPCTMSARMAVGAV